MWIGFDKPRTIVNNGYAGELAVPIWASFMKRATFGDQPDWFAPPPDVASVTVCRVSGKLPNVGCGSVQSFSTDGFYETRSLLYTEYFRRGSEPTSLCPIHAAPPVYIGTYSQPEPDPDELEPELPPPPPAGTTGTSPVLPPVEPVPPKVPQPPGGRGRGAGTNGSGADDVPAEESQRRGFWSRLFRGGSDQPADTRKQKPTKKKPGG